MCQGTRVEVGCYVREPEATDQTPAAVRLCSSTGQVLGGVLGRQETVEALAPFSLKNWLELQFFTAVAAQIGCCEVFSSCCCWGY